MSLTKETKIDQITVTENKTVLYRQVIKILEDGKVISTSYHRSSLVPGSDISNIPLDVANVCNAVWNAQVVTDFQNSLISQTQ